MPFASSLSFALRAFAVAAVAHAASAQTATYCESAPNSQGPGAQIGWGFQLQSPLVIGALAYLLFTLGLSLSGVLTIGERWTGVGQRLAGRPGYAGSFFTGALAAVAATPCTAPFMGVAVGYALTQPALPTLAVFERRAGDKGGSDE